MNTDFIIIMMKTILVHEALARVEWWAKCLGRWHTLLREADLSNICENV